MTATPNSCGNTFRRYLSGDPPAHPVRATYPLVRLTTRSHARIDSRLAYGFVSGPGVHETTVTRPDLFRDYLIEQIGLLMENHGIPVEIGESEEPIPIHFAFHRDINVETEGFEHEGSGAETPLRDVFDTPDLSAMDDSIANGTLLPAPGRPAPLAMFKATRIDYSLHRLSHYNRKPRRITSRTS